MENDKQKSNVCMACSCPCDAHQEHNHKKEDGMKCEMCGHEHKKGEACACGCK